MSRKQSCSGDGQGRESNPATALLVLRGGPNHKCEGYPERQNDERGFEGKEADQRARRRQRGAERDEVLASLEEIAVWYRDLIAVAVGAGSAAIHLDRLEQLMEDAVEGRVLGAERACEAIRETWRSFEEFNIGASLALEALFVQLRRELAPA